MPRKKPTKKLDVIGPFDLKPENATRQFLTSKAQEEFFVKPPNWDSPGESFELFLVQTYREHDVMLRLQKEMLETARRQAMVNRHRTKRLYTTQAHLRKRFIQVNSFIKDCTEKKEKAMKKLASENEMHMELRTGIKKYRKSIEELSEFREKLKQTVDEFSSYERVMDDVVEKSEIFHSPKDCMNRCDALMLAQVEIGNHEQQKINEIEQMRQRMAQVSNDAALQMLGFKTELAEMERTYSQANAEISKWEHILSKAKYEITRNEREKISSLDGVNTLYRMLCKRKGVEFGYQRYEMEKQLDFIKDEIDLLREVLKKCTKSAGNEKAHVSEQNRKC